MNMRKVRGVLALLALGGLIFCQAGQDVPRKPAVSPVEVSGIDDSKIPAFAKWLDENGTDPVAYTVEKCKKHQLVIVGERHGQKECLDLFKQAAIEAYHKAGVRVIAFECIDAEYNDKVARLVNGTEYDSRLALEIARSQNWYLWGYKEYWDILKAVWELNRSLPLGSERMTVIGIDKIMDLQLYRLWQENQLKDPALIEKAKSQPSAYDRDDWMAANIEKEILDKGRKGIVLIGLAHSFTHYGQPRFDKERKNVIGTWARFGVLLHRKYGEKIFQVGFHIELGPSSLLSQEDKGGEPLFTTFLERIMAVHGDKSVGFDVPGSPMATLRDSRSEYFYWQPNVTFSDLYRGYVFLKPVKSITPCGWLENFISDEMFEKSKVYYKYAFKREFKNAREINEFLETHPEER